MDIERNIRFRTIYRPSLTISDSKCLIYLGYVNNLRQSIITKNYNPKSSESKNVKQMRIGTFVITSIMLSLSPKNFPACF